MIQVSLSFAVKDQIKCKKDSKLKFDSGEALKISVFSLRMFKHIIFIFFRSFFKDLNLAKKVDEL